MMAEPKPMIFVKPAQGLSIPDPLTREDLAAEGEEKPDNQFWRRRLAGGDVVKTKKPPAVKPAKKES